MKHRVVCVQALSLLGWLSLSDKRVKVNWADRWTRRHGSEAIVGSAGLSVKQTNDGRDTVDTLAEAHTGSGPALDVVHAASAEGDRRANLFLRDLFAAAEIPRVLIVDIALQVSHVVPWRFEGLDATVDGDAFAAGRFVGEPSRRKRLVGDKSERRRGAGSRVSSLGACCRDVADAGRVTGDDDSGLIRAETVVEDRHQTTESRFVADGAADHQRERRIRLPADGNGNNIDRMSATIDDDRVDAGRAFDAHLALGPDPDYVRPGQLAISCDLRRLGAITNHGDAPARADAIKMEQNLEGASAEYPGKSSTRER
jgi:hypothetical protein